MDTSSAPVGLVFVGGEAPQRARIEPFLREPHVVVAADSGLHACLAMGVWPDRVVGDMDSVDPQVLASLPQDRVERHPRDKDATDTELAIEVARRLGASQVYLVGGGGGRLDHLLALRELFVGPGRPDRWYTPSEEVFALDAPSRVSIATEPGELISFFALDGAPRVESQGLKWNLDGFSWKKGTCSISNEALCVTISLDIKGGRILCIRHPRVTGGLTLPGTGVS